MKHNPQKKIPITAIQGFLGAGKTTLLNNLLANSQGLNIGVVVNDFGELNIDSKLIKSKTSKKLELSSGCICCSLQTLDLQEALAQFSNPNSAIDYVLIEASGLAEPRDLTSTLRYSLAQRFRLDSIVSIIDAHNITTDEQHRVVARDQIIFADFVVINKIDLVNTQTLNKVKKLVLALNPKARILETTNAVVDIDLILDQNPNSFDKFKNLKSPHNHGGHLHHQYQSLSWHSQKPLDPMKFQEFINRIDKSVYRAKGIINFGTKGANRKYILQLVGVRTELYWQNWHKQKAETQLVFIGKTLKPKELKTALQNCIDDNPESSLPKGIELRLPAKLD